MDLTIEDGADVASAPLQIQFDPKLLRLNDVTPGDYFSRAAPQPIFTKNIQNDTGSATVQLNRPPGAGGVSGSGNAGHAQLPGDRAAALRPCPSPTSPCATPRGRWWNRPAPR